MSLHEGSLSQVRSCQSTSQDLSVPPSSPDTTTNTETTSDCAIHNFGPTTSHGENTKQTRAARQEVRENGQKKLKQNTTKKSDRRGRLDTMKTSRAKEAIKQARRGILIPRNMLWEDLPEEAFGPLTDKRTEGRKEGGLQVRTKAQLSESNEDAASS